MLDIPIRVHFTFLFIVFWFASKSARHGGNVVLAVLFLLALFGCVVLHELGHALMARRFGVRTQEIVLYPIGGVARLQQMPSGIAEFLIAAAGPAVNVVIAAVLFVVLRLLGPVGHEVSWTMATLGSVASTLLVANIVIFGFNLVPAFPMDGGRMLRALLAILMGEQKATNIAALVGQGFAVVFGVVGLFQPNLLLVLIALFVFLGATQEAAFTRRRAVFIGRLARDAMITPVETLAPQDSLARATELLLDTRQQDFPVLDAWGRVVGVLSRPALLQGLAHGTADSAVLDAMDRDVMIYAQDAPLEEVLRGLQDEPGKPAIIVDDGEVLGMVTLENLAEFVEVARRAARKRAATGG
ncbi:MAG: site-2 protease family protein [Acidobacteriota bacterium]|nr:site-2 protease family protein [Acidobacteriota bacterium]